MTILNRPWKEFVYTSERLHYIMDNHVKAGDSHYLEKWVDLVVDLYGVSLRRPAGSGKWTPLQVAVITGYRLGVECLITKGVEPTQRAVDFARTHHPEFLPHLCTCSYVVVPFRFRGITGNSINEVHMKGGFSAGFE